MELELPEVERQDRVELPAAQTALLIVDMQNDFVHPDGALFVPDAAATLANVAALLDKARRAGARVVFTQDWHVEDDPEFAIWPRHAVAGSWGAEVVRELEPRADETRIHKLRYDAFYGTPLEHLLRLWDVRYVVVAGTVANICVLHTAGSAALRWFDVTLVEDAVSALTPFDMQATLRQVSFLYRGKITKSAGLVLV